MKALKILIVFTLCVSCSKDLDIEIDAELIPFFETFENEALERGIVINLEDEGVSGIIDVISDNTTVGQCQTSEAGNRRIVIDQNYWQGYDNSEKEFIVFHELGHCALGRTHDDTSDNGRICSSIMHSGTTGCRNDYGDDTREEYLDELFNY